jgi:RNA polymerase-binding transcription factor
MPAKKAASKQRKKTTATRKKAATGKAATRKATSRKRKVTKKKATASQRKKVAAGKKTSKKTAKKKAASKKAAPARKKVSKKKAAKKTAAAKTRTSSKKAPAKKKTPSKKKTASSARKSSGARSASKKRAPVKKAPARATRPRGNLLSAPIHGIDPYQPKRGEEYMSPEQLEHFRKILSAWKRELMFEVERTVHHMQDEAANFPDPNDRATQESEFGLELRTRDRERKLLRKIDSALARIDEGTYGYCDETGEEIGLKRLEARPVATLCLEAQERRELAERQFRDRDDRYR